MSLEHIALNISDPDEINNFYLDVLQLKLINASFMSMKLADKIFHISEESAIFILQREKLCLEVFVTSWQNDSSFNHICLAVNNREKLFLKAENKNYNCIRIERDAFDLMFIKDKYGNIFELKENN